jgi:hypothetical protein
MRFRISVIAPGEFDLAQRLINDLRVHIRGWDASRVDFKNGFILGSDKYYYFVKVDSPMLVVTNNPKWVVETVEAVVHVAGKLPVEIGIAFKEERGVINIEIILNPRQEGKKEGKN